MKKQGGLPANALHRQLQAGQILLIVILVIIVTSTVGLSIASRSITSLRTSTEEAESQKALAAAEAGIERAIQGSVPVEISNPNVLDSGGKTNSSYSTTVDRVDSSTFLINGGNIVPKDEGADVWFVPHDYTNTPDYSQAGSASYFNLYWGSASQACDTAAIQAVVVSRNRSTGEVKSYRYAYDSCSARRGNNSVPSDPGNHFTEAESGNFSPIVNINFTNRTPEDNLAKNVNEIIFIRVIPIYKDAIIAVSACDHNQTPATCTSLPTQGYAITSTGTSGQANRKLKVFKGYPQAYLPYLSYGLFVAN